VVRGFALFFYLSVTLPVPRFDGSAARPLMTVYEVQPLAEALGEFALGAALEPSAREALVTLVGAASAALRLPPGSLSGEAHARLAPAVADAQAALGLLGAEPVNPAQQTMVMRVPTDDAMTRGLMRTLAQALAARPVDQALIGKLRQALSTYVGPLAHQLDIDGLDDLLGRPSERLGSRPLVMIAASDDSIVNRLTRLLVEALEAFESRRAQGMEVQPADQDRVDELYRQLKTYPGTDDYELNLAGLRARLPPASPAGQVALGAAPVANLDAAPRRGGEDDRQVRATIPDRE
jgi:hypothetical protein